MQLVIESTLFFQNVPTASIPAFNLGIIAYFVLLFLLSGHCKLKLAKRGVCAGVMAVVMVVMMVLPYVPSKQTKLSFYESTGDTFCVSVKGQNYLFSQLVFQDDYRYIKNNLEEQTTLFITNFDDTAAGLAVELSKYTQLNINILSHVDYFDDDYVLLNKNKIETKRIKSFKDDNINVFVFDYLGKTLATIVEFEGFSFAYVNQLTDFQRGYLLKNMQKCDAYYSADSHIQIKQKYPESIVITKDYVDCDDIYATYSCGNFTISQRGAKMVFAK